jgi:hypothetical protein
VDVAGRCCCALSACDLLCRTSAPPATPLNISMICAGCTLSDAVALMSLNVGWLYSIPIHDIWEVIVAVADRPDIVKGGRPRVHLTLCSYHKNCG